MQSRIMLKLEAGEIAAAAKQLETYIEVRQEDGENGKSDIN